MQLEVAEEGSLRAIREAMDRGQFHVLHLTGHAAAGRMMLEDEAGRLADCGVAELHQRLRGMESLRLVFLSQCESAKTPTEAGEIHGFAQKLSESIPYVIGMQSSVGDGFATQLAGCFYGLLARGESPEKALARARASLAGSLDPLAAAPKGRRRATGAEYAIPVLYLRDVPRDLYDPNKTGQPLRVRTARTGPSEVSIRGLGDFVGRRTEWRRILTTLRNGDARVVQITGIGGIGKSTLAGHVGDRLRAHDYEALYFGDSMTLSSLFERLTDLCRTLAGRADGDESKRILKVLEIATSESLATSLTDRIRSLIRDALAGHKVLLVFDNRLLAVR